MRKVIFYSVLAMSIVALGAAQDEEIENVEEGIPGEFIPDDGMPPPQMNRTLTEEEIQQ